LDTFVPPLERACLWFGSQEEADAFAAAAVKALGASSEEVSWWPDEDDGEPTP